MVAEQADGWNTVWVWTPATYMERLTSLERACEAAGRDPSTVWRTLGLYTLVGEDEADLERRYRQMQADAPNRMLEGTSLDEWRKGRLVGTVEEVREQLAGWEALGVEQLIACPGPLPFSVSGVDEVDLIGAAFRP
jgi:alkanesulfonate monooxygenase SsuD/methylene tetrahydromethanopterin reductase-like flavin-dependent oxidoreductase (luciferase family)